MSALSEGFLVGAVGLLALATNAAEPGNASKSAGPKVMPASNEAELAMKRFTLPPGFKIELFAAEPHLANPVAFHVDEHGRFYVVETFRLGAGVLDIRGRRGWPGPEFMSSAPPERLANLADELLDADLANRTADDRVGMLKKYFGSKIGTLTNESDRVRLIEDRDGDGRADHDSVFADGFSNIADGLAAGVLARKGEVFFANIPDLWSLRDTKNTGTADVRRSLSHGYGVHIGFLGHDSHGLRFGPDGKLYFSIGDRGSAVKTREGKIVGHPDCGSVFRCNSDGSELEEFAYGLRNPQELTFDDFGNLFTGDNNSDSGDQARWVYLVEGGDSGWRIGYQFMESPYTRGPFNAEKIWYPQFAGQAAYIVPPITNIANGPSGVTYYPGTGLPDNCRGSFFLVDFKGANANSGVHTFKLAARGAGFTMIDHSQFAWNILATDADFGVDGGLYISDWVAGWNMTGKGRIYRVFEPNSASAAVVKETKKIRAEGMEKRSTKELVTLLAHRDQRVRLEAQFELADRGVASLKPLAAVAKANANQLARLHAIWALGQIQQAKFRSQNSPGEISEPMKPLLPLLADGDGEVRAQAAKVLGDARCRVAFDGLVKQLRDASPRVRFFAAQGLSKLGRSEGNAPVLAMLRENADQDPFLRHAGVMALSGIGDVDALLRAAKDDSAAVRMGVLLTLRRLGRPEVAQFVNDDEPLVVLEAARAINDEPINAAMPELAALLDDVPALTKLKPEIQEPLLRRVLNANFRLGRSENAKALAQFASRGDAPEFFRAEALRKLGEWPKPSGRDHIVGVWRPLVNASRDPFLPASALRPLATDLLKTAPDPVRIAAARAVGQLGLIAESSALVQIVANAQLAPAPRIEALKSLAALKSDRLNEALKFAQSAGNESLRKEATRLQAQTKSSGALASLNAALEKGSLGEQQAALAALGEMDGLAADEILARWLDRLESGELPKELQLDLLEAAAKRTSPSLKEKLQDYRDNLPKDDSFAGFRETLYGGSAAEGKKIVFERAEAACIKCHKVGGEGGEVGPELTGIGSRQTREYLLES
ncbi:MAG: HEAT repeat domain-containing protein, partial [Verrucomicrobia bacterium]|nr:HEAT repeat domain-containing protein [Verrucomicrobiota bacterium]